MLDQSRAGNIELLMSISWQTFQAEVFKRFLDGSTLEECYESVAAVANLWLDVLVRQLLPCFVALVSEFRPLSDGLTAEECCGRAAVVADLSLDVLAKNLHVFSSVATQSMHFSGFRSSPCCAITCASDA